MIAPLRSDLNRVPLIQSPASAASLSQHVDAVKQLLMLASGQEVSHFSAERANCKLWQRSLSLSQVLWTALQAEPHRRRLFTKSGVPYSVCVTANGDPISASGAVSSCANLLPDLSP